MIIPGSQLLGVFGTNTRAGLQKKLLVTNRPGSKDSMVYFAQVFFSTSLGQLPGVFITVESQLHSGEYTESLDSPVVSTPGSQLKIQITPKVFEKIRSLF
jgi:hypothetical protein